jgi:glycosyltransferase involved in cell wall biosynthesis
MIIGIDARFALKSRRGIGNYSLELINQLCREHPENTYILYVDQPDKNAVLPGLDNCSVKFLTPSNFIIWEQVILPYHLRKDNIDVLHCVGNTGPIWFSRHTKMVLTIHDVMFFNNINVSGLYNFIGNMYRRHVVKRLIRKVSQIITVSHFSKKDIVKELGIDPDKIEVIWESYNEEYGKNKDLIPIENERYILCLGANDPRKNTNMIIEVFADLAKSDLVDKLVIVGFNSWQSSKAYKLAVDKKLADKIVFKDYISDNQLVNYYKFASLFLYVSLYEGFGIPPLDAMACGCPVVASDVTSIPEIVGEAGLLVSPYSKDEIYNACVELINDRSLREQLVAKGFERIKAFSWGKMSQDILDVYTQVNGKNKN